MPLNDIQITLDLELCCKDFFLDTYSLFYPPGKATRTSLLVNVGLYTMGWENTSRQKTKTAEDGKDPQ